MDLVWRKEVFLYESWYGEVIVSSRENGMKILAKKRKSKGNFIVKVLLCDMKFDNWIWGSWIGLQGLVMIGLVDRKKERRT